MQSYFVLVLAYGTVGHLLQLVRFNRVRLFWSDVAAALRVCGSIV